MSEPRPTDEEGLAMMRELIQAHEALDLLMAQENHHALPAEQQLRAAARRLLTASGQISTRMAVQTANRGVFHWTVTLSALADGRQTLASDHGVVRPAASDTRQSLCEQLTQQVTAQTEQAMGKHLSDVRLLHFDLQPNELPR